MREDVANCPDDRKDSAVVHRVIWIADVLIACVVVWLTAARILYHLDITVTGAAFATLIYWPSRWSWSFVAHVAVSAYFFHCVVLFIAGTEATKSIVFANAVIGLAGIGIAYALRRIVIRRVDRDARAAPHQSLEVAMTDTNGNDELEQDESVARDTTGLVEKDQSDWTPIQFGMDRILFVLFAFASLFAVARTSGTGAAMVVLLFLPFWYLLAGCVRLVSAR